jgi:ATP-dependent RNA helicase SUPV3L1/SUV3
VGTEVRALLLTLADRGGLVQRESAGLAVVPKEKRPLLRRLGVTIGALDVFVPALLKPGPRALLKALGGDPRPIQSAMKPVIAGAKHVPAGYRRAGSQAIRVDMAEKLFRAAHDARGRAGGRAFRLDAALATSMGLAADNLPRLMRDAGFRPGERRNLAEGTYGPPAPLLWSWRPPRKDRSPEQDDKRPVNEGGAFAGLAELFG